MRLRLVRENTNFDFFTRWKLWLGISGLMVVIAAISFLIQGLNFGIDFRGGTTIRTESPTAVDVGAYRNAIQPLGLGDVLITEVFDPTFGESRNVCNVHWYSDVVAGRLVGAAAVAKLHDNKQFLAAMDAARSDIARARAAGLTPTVDCEAEARALATPLQ